MNGINRRNLLTGSAAIAAYGALRGDASAAAPSPAPERRGRSFMGSWFTNADTYSGLRIGTSMDGIDFTDTGVFYDPYPDIGLRDPSIVYFAGALLLCYTNVPDTRTPTTTFSVATSLDNGRSFKRIGSVDCSAASGSGSSAFVWAPEWFIDRDGSLHVVVSVSSNGRSTFQLYALHPRDPGNLAGLWSAPIAITGSQSTLGIDPDLKLIGATYYLFFKPNDYIACLSSQSPFSGYNTVVGKDGWGNWGHFQEGPSVVVFSPIHWRMYLDNSAGGGGIRYSDTFDGGKSWGSLAAIAESKIGSGINLHPQPRNFARNTSVGGSLTISSGPTHSGMDGSYSGFTITDPTSLARASLESNVPIAADSSWYCYSIGFLKTPHASTFPGMSAQFTGGTGLETGVVLNTNSGVAYPASGWGTRPPPPGHCGVEDMGAYWRAWLFAQNNGTNNNVSCWLMPAANGNGMDGTRGDSNGGSVIASCRNLTKGKTLHPFDENTSAPTSSRHGTVILTG